MILLAVQGGLGNQLFQYAFARRLALECGEPIWIEQSRYHDPKLTQFRRLELPGLAAPIARILPPDVMAFPAGEDGPFAFEGHSFQRILDSGQSHATLGPRPENIALKGEWSADVRYLYDADFLCQLRADFTAQIAPTSAAYLAARARITAAAHPVWSYVRKLVTV